MPPPMNFTPELSQPQPGSDAALALGWTYPSARQACDDFARGGSFALAWQLWLDCDTHPGIAAAKEQRISMAVELPWEVCGDRRASRAPGRIELEASQDLWKRHGARLLDSTLSDVIGMGMSVWQHPSAVNPATLRREVIAIERWPLSQVRFTSTPIPDVWNPGRWIEGYYAVQFGVGPSLGAVMFDPETGRSDVRFLQLPRPGETDGHWTVFGRGDRPHLRGAIRRLDVAFVAGQIGRRSLANLIKTLGRQSPVGILPGTTSVDSPEGRAMEKVVAGLGTSTTAAVLPGGSQMTAFSLTTQTAGLFVDNAALNLQDVELAILGRSESLAKADAQYVAKGGPAERVPEKLVRTDVGVIADGASALFQLIAEQNVPSPGLIYLDGHMPDTEQADRRKAEQDLRQKYLAELAAEKLLGIPLTQEHADALAARYGVEPVIVPVASATVARLDLAPTDIAKVVRVDEARASRDLPPIGDERGALTIGQLDAAPTAVAPAPEQNPPQDAPAAPGAPDGAAPQTEAA